MGIVSKEGYAAKKRWAERNMAQQSEIGMANGLTEAQACALEDLCKARHNFHVAMDDMAGNDEADNTPGRKLDAACQEMEKVGLPSLWVNFSDFIPTSAIWYNDCVEDFYPDESFADYSDFYEEDIGRAIDELSEMNEKVEKYLSDIDEVYGTHYCPTGAKRL